MDYAKLTAQARQATEELLEAAHLETGDIFVVGCSSSEIMGGHIGKDSSMEAAAAVLAGVLPPLQEQGVYLAAQCCEHLNRAIVIERTVARANGYQIVAAIPQPHAGGSWATNCWRTFNDPVLVEEVKAAAGMDIGGTLIGMHLRRVAVPVRLSMNRIGQAILLCARTRPPFIGGSRGVYSQEAGRCSQQHKKRRWHGAAQRSRRRRRPPPGPPADGSNAAWPNWSYFARLSGSDSTS